MLFFFLRYHPYTHYDLTSTRYRSIDIAYNHNNNTISFFFMKNEIQGNSVVDLHKETVKVQKLSLKWKRCSVSSNIRINLSFFFFSFFRYYHCCKKLYLKYRFFYCCFDFLHTSCIIYKNSLISIIVIHFCRIRFDSSFLYLLTWSRRVVHEF